VENIPAADTFPAESHLFCVFNEAKEYEEALHGHPHLCGADMLERLQASSQNHSHVGKEEDKLASNKTAPKSSKLN
jgi:hypothetical protein